MHDHLLTTDAMTVCRDHKGRSFGHISKISVVAFVSFNETFKEGGEEAEALWINCYRSHLLQDQHWTVPIGLEYVEKIRGLC